MAADLWFCGAGYRSSRPNRSRRSRRARACTTTGSRHLELAASYNDLARRIGALESDAARPTDCTPMKIATRSEIKYDSLAAVTSGPIGIRAYTGYACAAS